MRTAALKVSAISGRIGRNGSIFGERIMYGIRRWVNGAAYSISLARPIYGTA
jgi:hypothetical protein